MNPSQIAYYDSLTDETKLILQAAAFESYFIDYRIVDRIFKTFRLNFTQKKNQDCN